MRDMNTDLTRAREARGESIERLHEINDTALLAKRDLNDAERNEFATHEATVRRASGEIDRIERLLNIGDLGTARRGNDGTRSQLAMRCSLFELVKHQMGMDSDIGAIREWQAEQLRLNPREMRGHLFPLYEQRAILTHTGALGGFLVQDELRDDLFIQPIRERTAVGSLGATILPNLRGDIAIPKQTATIAGRWVNEDEAVVEGTPTFGQVQLRPRHVGSYVSISRQAAIQGTPQVEQLIRTDLEQQLNIALDKAAINGSGVGAEPLGVMQTSGVNSEPFAVDVPSMAELYSLPGALDADGTLDGSLGFICHPSMIARLRVVSLDEGSGRFLCEGVPPQLINYKTATTKHVPFAVNATNLLFGNWADLLIGMWSGVDILVNPYAETPFLKGGVWIHGFLTCDVAVRRPESFVRGHHTVV